jgi:5-methylcytosine-specific restriction endonuclease McrA
VSGLHGEPCLRCDIDHEDAAYVAPCGTDGPEDCLEWAECGSPLIEHTHDHDTGTQLAWVPEDLQEVLVCRS